MFISRNWLQSYFATELPPTEDIAETLMMHAFELEGIDHQDTDSVIDIDVLPNRAHDCLSHAGVAREYAALTRNELLSDRYHYHDIVTYTEDVPTVILENNDQCYRYVARYISHVTVSPSPDWLGDRLTAIGQRSINNIVDATNYVMFDTGQPIHAFDADKVVGDIIVRNAEDGEQMITLTGEEIILTPNDLVIADNEGVLALAGVKGGRKAEVDEHTTNIILEVANFNPLTTRQTARRVKLHTDSSKRFENAISSELAPHAMEYVSMLISDVAHTDGTTISGVSDTYPVAEPPRTITLSLGHIQRLLGIQISTRDVTDIFERLGYQHHEQDDVFEVHVPFERLDLTIPEDVIEEIGRIYGYHNIDTQDVGGYTFTPRIHPQVYLQNTIKNMLVERGFCDVMTYSFTKKGEVMVKNPIASDKAGLRKNLHTGLQDALELNSRNQDFFGGDRTQLFEIGRVYTKDGEANMCSIAVMNAGTSANKKYGIEREQLETLVVDIGNHVGTQIDAEYHGNTLTFPLDTIHIDPKSYENIFDMKSYEETATFHSISPYPFVTRDISFWAPQGITDDIAYGYITATDTSHLVKVFLFDQFEKEGRVSYAFSLVFQSPEQTLTDVDVDSDMQNIQRTLEYNGCEIR
ncbi:phenylalanine--tRNA ligase subunit beta [Patescibacteria group bacterium]|nr:phenylalanine--tRNA ligase subunit beta [Patescibacteria group bacterium]